MANLNDVYRVVLLSAAGNQLAFNVRHYVVSNKLGTGATDAQFAASADTTYAAALKACMSSVAEYRGVAVGKIWPLPPTIGVTGTVGNGFGAIAGDPLPFTTSGLLNFRTGFAGRKYRGRMYVPFPPEARNDANGDPDVTYQGLLATLLAQALLTITTGVGGNTNDFKPCIWHEATKTTDVITTGLVRKEWATQRRRSQWKSDAPPPW